MTAAEQLEARGLKKGIIQGIETTVRNFKALNVLSDQQIADATGLTLEEVKALTPTKPDEKS